MGLMVIFLPLLTSLTVFIFNRHMGSRGVFTFLVGGMLTTTFLSYFLTYCVFSVNSFEVYEYIIPFTWGEFYWGSFQWGFLWDSITGIMVSTVCTVSTLVHLYSWYYMGADPYFKRFMSYLSLFTFFMLFLVGSNNLLQLFFGWEGVGLCSYLLINFWYTRRQANKSALKAVLVNRIGDCALLFAIVLLVIQFGSVRYDDLFMSTIFQPVGSYFMGISFIDIVCFLLFIGVMAKSAQAGLHTWLPDAMEGPTPVSALIHAATMVTAGIYMMIRMGPLFECSPITLTFAIVVGSLTAFFAATTALFQHDLKKVIAYSTCSQLGYMVIACGSAQFSLAFFHLVNHAFFKALLFLGAGAIIHSLEGEQDVRKMGGLRNIYPIGLTTTVVASAALTGLPFLAGFYSKDVILAVLLCSSWTVSNVVWFFGCLAAICTSMYSWSLVYFIFFGKPRGSFSQYRSLHGIPWQATAPMVVLAVLSVISGYLLKDILVGPGNENALLTNSAEAFSAAPAFFSLVEWVPLWSKIVASALGFIGIIYYSIYELFGGIVFYSPLWLSLYRFFYFRWYWDQLQNHFISWPLFRSFYFIFYKILDKGFVELVGVVSTAQFGVSVSRSIAMVQNGSMARYLSLSAIGFIVMWEFGKLMLNY